MMSLRNHKLLTIGVLLLILAAFVWVNWDAVSDVLVDMQTDGESAQDIANFFLWMFGVASITWLVVLCNCIDEVDDDEEED